MMKMECRRLRRPKKQRMEPDHSTRKQNWAVMSRRRLLGLGAALAAFPAAAAELLDDMSSVSASDWSDEVTPVSQPENVDLCWLAAAAMVQSWLAERPVSLADAAHRLGVDFESLFFASAGLPVDEIPSLAAQLNMKTAPLAGLHPDWWAQQMRCGPMILIGMTEISPEPHARVLLSVGYGSNIRSANVKYVDPLDGIVYLRSLIAIEQFYANLPMQHPEKQPPTQVLFFTEEPTTSRLQFDIQESDRIMKSSRQR
ncbi:papain-like cysteine protease family protein [Paraburkholderia sp. BL6665CI2N2]|uniref:papain-like cysteine protease family protein n=1 Tax=Paraburkholderia sp. BL6665CI2N2 TaxID=1938806 RepID=UPI001416F513|nr:papain-like cysteine protease family protein [Paraburkholderia sp. BL6665CI2N2]